MKKPLLLLLFGLTSLQPAFAQFTLSAEIRPRAEYRNGFKTLNSEATLPAFFIEQRSRLISQYKHEKLSLGLTLQDVRIWGETAQINKSDGLSSVHEAWAGIQLSSKLSLKLGRQELAYDDQRILGSLNWAAQGRSHDALKFQLADSVWELHSVFAFNQNSNIAEPARLSGTFYPQPGSFAVAGGGLPNYKNLQLLWVKRNFQKATISAMLLNTGWQMADTTVNYLLTVGTNLNASFSPRFRLSGSAYYQLGNNLNDQEVGSWLAALEARYQLKPTSTFLIGYTSVSGSAADQEPGTTNAFDPLFGTHHKFYGLMDYFYVGNPHAQAGNTLGLQDYYLGVQLKPLDKLSLNTTAHYFRSPVAILDPTDLATPLTPELGKEVDVVATYAYQPAITFSLGYSQMFATESMEVIKGGDRKLNANWAWAMVTVKPTLLTSGK